MPGGGAKAVMVTMSGDSVTVAVGFLLHELTVTDRAPSAARPASTSLVGTGSTSVTTSCTTANTRRPAATSTAAAMTRAQTGNGTRRLILQIGRASGRERVCQSV